MVFYRMAAVSLSFFQLSTLFFFSEGLAGMAQDTFPYSLATVLVFEKSKCAIVMVSSLHGMVTRQHECSSEGKGRVIHTTPTRHHHHFLLVSLSCFHPVCLISSKSVQFNLQFYFPFFFQLPLHFGSVYFGTCTSLSIPYFRLPLLLIEVRLLVRVKQSGCTKKNIFGEKLRTHKT